MEIKHFSHKHPLILANGEKGGCYACYASRDDIYECKPCGYRLHKGCSELPEKFLNPYHPHPLYAVPVQGTEVHCDACFCEVRGFFYHCQNCNFNLHAHCASYKPTTEAFHHFCHFHPLELNDGTDDDFCSLCCSGRSGYYMCSRCDFYVDQRCSELEFPKEIQHPDHPCVLTYFTLLHVGIYESILHVGYQCKNCNFRLDFDSYLSLIEKSKGEKQFYHFSHRHPLELTDQNSEDIDQVKCFACGKFSSAPTYGCNSCQFFLHQSCVDFPVEIQHFFHPCHLTLRIQPNSFNCGACDRTIQGFYYHCEWCNFSLDTECALLPTIKSESQLQFCHLGHGHPLTLTEIKQEDKVYCSACKRCCSSQAFVCEKCSFFLDRSCFELARELQYAFHPNHPLTLIRKPTKLNSVCNVCCKSLNGFTYRCGHCEFEMHPECKLLSPTVSYEGHNHLLLFLENIDGEVICNSCDTPCNSSVFHCVECDFNLHFLCGPLPCTIKHECHYDLLLLTDSPLDDESDEFYCDACEERRDPRLPVYYCKMCLFPAEIKCVISEIVLTLKGHNGDVQLRTPVGQMYGKVISKNFELKELEPEQQNSNKDAGKMENKPVLTWDDMLNSFNEDENKELKGVLEGSRKDIIAAGETSSTDPSNESEDSIFSCSDLLIAFSGDQKTDMNSFLAASERDADLKVSLFSDRAYKHFLEKLDSSTNYSSLTLWDGNQDVVNVKGNLTTRKFARILQELFDKYGDVSSECRLSPRVKSYFLVMLCGTLYSMCNTRIMDISKNLLLNWWNNLKVLKFAGFKVQFAFDHLKKVAHAYFGLEVENAVSELDMKLANLSALIEKSTRESKELKEKREFIALAEASKSSIIMDCLTKASTQKWRSAGSGLL